MFRQKRMLLVNAADGDADSVDFGNFFGGGGATKNEADDQADDQDQDQDVEDYDSGEDEDSDDGDADEQDGDSGDAEDAEEDDDTEADDSDPTTISMAAIKQQQEILADLLRQKKEAEAQDAQKDEVPDVDPFESEEFSSMVEVMNWDEDEAKAAKTFFQKFMDWGNKKAYDRFSQETPQVVETTIQRNERIKEARRSFYETHPILNQVKPFVGQIAQGVAQEMGQNATMEAVLEESANRAYKALGIDPSKVQELASSQAKKSKAKPAFPVKKGARKQTTKPPKLQQEIDAVIGL